MDKTVLSLKPLNLVVQVRLTANGKTVTVPRAILDTGASASVIDMALAKKLGMKLRKVGYGRQVRGKLTVYRGAIERLDLLHPGKAKTMCSVGPLAMDVINFGTGGAMLLGSDILKHFKLQIGFNTKQIVLQCKNPGSLLGVLVLGRATGAW